MKVYYSHSMKTYGTELEEEEMVIIKKNFPNAEIVNPPSFEGSLRKRKAGMAFCHRLIDECDVLVFSKFQGIITSGVGDEVNYALRKKRKVFEIKEGKLIPQHQPVTYIPYSQTIRIYKMLDRKLI